MDIKKNLALKNGDIEYITDWNTIKESLENIILSTKGTKKFNYNFGCSLDDFINMPSNSNTIDLLSTVIRFNIETFEKRVKIKYLNISVQNSTYYIKLIVEYNNINNEVSLTI